MKTDLDVKLTAALAIILFSILAISKGQNFANEILSVISTAVSWIVVLRLLYVKWLWKLKPFRLLQSIHRVPYLEGHWVGEYQSTGNVNTGMEKRSGPVEVEICQPSIHTLKIIRRSLESTSRSFGEEFLYDCDGIVQIIYSYRSEPKATVRERSAISYGSARLMLDKVNSKKIEGDYWTDQKTTGTLSLVKKE